MACLLLPSPSINKLKHKAEINDLHRECMYMEINTVSKNKALVALREVRREK